MLLVCGGENNREGGEKRQATLQIGNFIAWLLSFMKSKHLTMVNIY